MADATLEIPTPASLLEPTARCSARTRVVRASADVQRTSQDQSGGSASIGAMQRVAQLLADWAVGQDWLIVLLVILAAMLVRVLVARVLAASSRVKLPSKLVNLQL